MSGGRRSGRRHDHDAGGDLGLLAAKAELREHVWRSMGVPGVRRFPAPDGRIPHFVGAESAAARLATTPEWQAATTVKANPDAPQLPVRARALVDGKVVYMAVPRLAEDEPFFLLDPAALVDAPSKAATIAGASRSARRVHVEDLAPVELVVTGCVAVGRDGARLGKGGGFSDLEFAVTAAAGLVDDRTVVVTTVHALQVVEAGVVPTTAHDLHVDLVVTPDEVLRCPRPAGHRLPALRWEELTDEKVSSIPLLGRLRAGGRGGAHGRGDEVAGTGQPPSASRAGSSRSPATGSSARSSGRSRSSASTSSPVT